MERLLSLRETATTLAVHYDTLRRWDRQGRLRALRINDRGDRRWEEEKVISFIGVAKRRKPILWQRPRKAEVLEETKVLNYGDTMKATLYTRMPFPEEDEWIIRCRFSRIHNGIWYRYAAGGRHHFMELFFHISIDFLITSGFSNTPLSAIYYVQIDLGDALDRDRRHDMAHYIASIQRKDIWLSPPI